MVQKGGVSACAWLDRKVVMAMFSNSQPSSTGSVLRRQKENVRISNCHVKKDERDVLSTLGSTGVVPTKLVPRSTPPMYLLYMQEDGLRAMNRSTGVVQKNFYPDNVHKNLKEFRLQLARELNVLQYYHLPV